MDELVKYGGNILIMQCYDEKIHSLEHPNG